MNMNIFNNLTGTFHRIGFQIKQHSPEIMVIGGVVGTVASAVLACKATTKLDAVLENAKFEIDAVNKAKETGEVAVVDANTTEVSVIPYTPEDHKKDLAVTYLKNGLRIAKLYAPSVLLGAGSVYCILAGHNVLRKRHLSLLAAYATERLGFKEYRNNVIDRFGEALDRELKYNIKKEEVEEVVTNEDGTETTVKKTVDVPRLNQYSSYARIFDETCRGWEKNAEMNHAFLNYVQNHCNEILRSRRHLYLNEVYEMLGFDKTVAGHNVGWRYDEEDPTGDNYVDFGIYDIHDPDKRAFVNGYERSIVLDFNVDGYITERVVEDQYGL